MCMAKPISEELVHRVGHARMPGPSSFRPGRTPCSSSPTSASVAERVVELRLRPVGQPIRYWPGQYVTLGNPRADIPARAYSISNAPRPDGELVLQVARADGGVTSNWIHDSLGVGESVKVSGAYGTFIGDPGVDTPVLCLAAGTGLAPILALTEAALRRGFRKPVTLLFSARSEADVFTAGACWPGGVPSTAASTTRSP
jgi:CDP-4-dehydro-6-deoxyglucose reductase